MNKNYKDSIPDWLPPALVKDWRQMLRTPLFMLGLLALGLLSFGFLLLPTVVVTCFPHTMSTAHAELLNVVSLQNASLLHE